MNSTGNHTNSLGSQIAANGNDFQFYKETHSLQVLRLIFQVLLASVGVAGNAIVCLVITFQPQMHTTINYFIRNLAIADLGILILSFPLAVIMEQVPSYWPLGEFFCLYIFPLSDIFFGVSVWSIALIAVDRHRAIVRGALPKRGSTVFKSVRRMVASVWIISFLIISLPLYFVMNFNDHRPVVNIVECSPKWPNKEEEDEMRQMYIIGLTFFWYVLPLAIVTVTFGSITRKLRTSTRFNKSIRDDSGRDTEKRARKRLRERQNSKAKKLLTPVVLVFAVTMLPLNVFRLVFLYWKEFTLHKYFWVYYNVCVICVITNSSANFFIYSVVSEEFRQSFKSFICRKIGVPSNSVTERTLRSPALSPTNLSPISNRNDENRSRTKNNNTERETLM